MMRKLFLTLFMIVVIGILAGCTIPIGDGELSISSDGIDFSSGDEVDSLAEDDDDTLVNTPDDDGMTEDADEANVMGMDDGDDPMDGNDPGQQAQQQQAASGSACNDPQNHSALTNNIGVPFHFPECAVITNQSLSPTQTEAYLILSNSDWEDIAAEYREALTQYDVTEESNFDNKQVQFNFLLDEELWGTSRVRVSQQENDVEIYVRIYTE